MIKTWIRNEAMKHAVLPNIATTDIRISDAKMISLVLIICFTLGCPVLTMAEEYILKAQSIPVSEKLYTLDLFSEEKLMGGTNSTTKSVISHVTVGKGSVSFLPPIMSKSSEPNGIDRSKQDLYLIRIPFTLHEFDDDAYYKKIKFQVMLTTPGAIAFDLLPKDVSLKVAVARTYTISPQFKFKGIDAQIGGADWKISFESLQPIISTFGEGESLFYWIYTSQEGQKVLPGTKHALIIVEVPRGIKSIQGTIYYEAVIENKLFGVWKSKEVQTDKQPIDWTLSETTNRYK